MTCHWRVRAGGLAVLLGSVVVMSGCSGGGPGAQGTDPNDPEAAHLRDAYALVKDYTVAKKRNPENLEQVEKWAKADHKKVDADTFVSTRDHEQYVLEETPMGDVLHEKTGEGGKLYSVSFRGQVQLTTEQNLRTMMDSIKRGAAQYGNRGK